MESEHKTEPIMEEPVDRTFLAQSTNPIFAEDPKSSLPFYDPVSIVSEYILTMLKASSLCNWKGYCVSRIVSKTKSKDEKKEIEIETDIWVPVMKLEQFIIKSCSRSVNFFQWTNITSGRDVIKKVVSKIKNANDPRFPVPIVTKDTIAFCTGIYSLSKNTLFSYQQSEMVRQEIENAVAGTYIQLPMYHRSMRLPSKWDSEKIEYIDDNLDTQGFDQNGRLLFWAMIGKILMPEEKRIDNWTFENILMEGESMSGKNTLAKALSGIYNRENIWKTTVTKDIKKIPLEKEQMIKCYLVEISEILPEHWDNFVTLLRTFFLREKMAPPPIVAVSRMSNSHVQTNNVFSKCRTLCFMMKKKISNPDRSASKKIWRQTPNIIIKAVLAYRQLVNTHLDLQKPLPNGIYIL